MTKVGEKKEQSARRSQRLVFGSDARPSHTHRSLCEQRYRVPLSHYARLQSGHVHFCRIGTLFPDNATPEMCSSELLGAVPFRREVWDVCVRLSRATYIMRSALAAIRLDIQNPAKKCISRIKPQQVTRTPRVAEQGDSPRKHAATLLWQIDWLFRRHFETSSAPNDYT